MELFEASEAFSSLAQETRLRVFKRLIEYGCDGAVPSQIAKELKIPDNTLSFHLSHMTKVGLISAKKQGRSITYLANHELIVELIGYLQENCCNREQKARVRNKSTPERKC